jgi:glycosyltransferase involved in cell wall biosynthesis
MEFVESLDPHLYICTINFNNAHGLNRTISSYSNIPKSLSHSIIIVDGGSVDGSVDIIRDSTYHYISERDWGVYDAMNKGVAWAYNNRKSHSKCFLIFMNSGDEFHAECEFLTTILGESNDDVLVFNNYKDDGSKDKRYQLGLLKYGFMPFCHQSVIYSISRLEIGHVLFSTNTRSYNDYRQMYELYSKGFTINYSDGFLSIYEQITTTGLSRSSCRFRLEKLRIVFELMGFTGLFRVVVFKILSNRLKVEV